MPATVGRLAPSPTGGLHLGHARTFLVAWLMARRAGGEVLLRIEDIDAGRARPGAAEAMVEDFRWLGLDWDRGPICQSSRLDRYRSSLDRLKSAERVYPCTCTRADIARAASAPHAEDEGPTYPGTCAGRSAADAAGLDRPYAWRFRVASGPVAWDDLFLGEMAVDPATSGGDFVVARSTGEPAYQLAVVVDDAEMGVTQVVRGVDLRPSTPRQILLYQALGLGAPRFGHVGLVLGPDGVRLAKRDAAVKLSSLRESGIAPERLVELIAATIGLPDRPARPVDLIGEFRPESLDGDPRRLDPSAL